MAGKLPRLPVFGPARSRPGAKDRGGPELGKGGGGGTGSGRPEDGAKTGDSDIGEHAVREGAGEAVAPEAVPERYRAATKRYFSTEPAGPAPVKDPPP
jgi:hypothetical protein